jgi:D-3-phosphoglycerate dehydrogenase
MVDEAVVDIPPAEHMLVVRNSDTPGMIGRVGVTLGDAGVNISDMVVGQTADGVAALMVLATDRQVLAPVVAALETQPGIESVSVISG